MKFDKAERTILQVLQQEGRISNVELAERIGLSESPCFRRVRRLEEAGVIRGYSARLDRRKLGLQVTAFVQVSLDKEDETKQRAFLARVEAEEHIVECHAMSGSHDYLLKVLARNMDHFAELSMQRILKFPGVKSIESNFSLVEIKESSPLPVRQA
jgi:Lrp/AsnC family leucine-responsive transcriptional regulator